MKQLWKDVFAPDSGSLLDIRVYDTTANDHETLLKMLAHRYCVQYSEDGIVGPLPDYATIVDRRNSHSLSISVDISGVHVKSFFWSEEEIILDLFPERVDSPQKADAIFNLMKAIAETLNKRVLLTAENTSATRQWSEEHAICAFDPPR